MSLDSKSEIGLDQLTNQLRNASAPTADLVRNVVNICVRFRALKQAGKTTNVDRLIEAGAWCDAALALIAAEMPTWSVRRIVHEDGEWFCSLTREPNLPATLDDTADASHRALPLAILGAFLEVKRRIGAACDLHITAVPELRPAFGFAICCDNFG
jgi:hypothetical protein